MYGDNEWRFPKKTFSMPLVNKIETNLKLNNSPVQALIDCLNASDSLFDSYRLLRFWSRNERSTSKYVYVVPLANCTALLTRGRQDGII